MLNNVYDPRYLTSWELWYYRKKKAMLDFYHGQCARTVTAACEVLGSF